MKYQICRHIETSESICKTGELTGFYEMATLVINELIMIEFHVELFRILCL